MSSQLVATFTIPARTAGSSSTLPADCWDGWVRCPSCGRIFLPPEPERLPRGIEHGCRPQPA